MKIGCLIAVLAITVQVPVLAEDSEAVARDEDAPATAAPAASQGRTPASPSASRAVSDDALELQTTSITGNRELPKVMVIVPWKSAELGEVRGRPINSLVEDVLTPIDPDVFRRQLDYYGLLYGDEPAAQVAKESVESGNSD